METKDIKAIELLSESIKTSIGLATIVFAGFAAYGSNNSAFLNDWKYYLALSALLLCAVLGILNINALINKAQRGETGAVHKNDVVSLNVGMSVCFFVGLIFVGITLANSNSASFGNTNDVEQGEVIFTGNDVLVGQGVTTSIEIQKSDTGRILSISIN